MALLGYVLKSLFNHHKVNIQAHQDLPRRKVQEHLDHACLLDGDLCIPRGNEVLQLGDGLWHRHLLLVQLGSLIDLFGCARQLISWSQWSSSVTAPASVDTPTIVGMWLLRLGSCVSWFALQHYSQDSVLMATRSEVFEGFCRQVKTIL